ncbi:MAG: LysR family transcriptional regulator [Parvularcula sp.]
MDRFSALTVFRRVIELNGFAAAARDLGVSNAAVSKTIKDLEGDLGAQLIVRTTRSLRLTDTGHEYYHAITQLLDKLLDADEMARSSGETLRGRLRISAPMSLGVTLLSSLVPEFSAQHPELQIDLELSDKYIDLIEDGFDLAIRGGKLKDSSLRARKLIEMERIVCASPAYIERNGSLGCPADLAQHNCLIYSLSSSPKTWRLESPGQHETVSVDGNYRANSSLAIRDAAVGGLGLAFIPRIFVDTALSSGGLINALPQWTGEKHALFGVYPEHREPSRKIRLFLDFLVHTLSEHRK